MARKVSIIGAGNVGATLAMRVLESGLADVALVDVFKNLAIGKALDLADASPVAGHERKITGGDRYEDIGGSDIVVVTAGLARKPGMSREDLIAKNTEIVTSVAKNIKEFAPQAIVIIVTNPLDTMTYVARKVTGFDRKRVFGMAGALDGSRMIYLIAEELKVPRSSVKTFILGSHGDTMVPLISHTTVGGKPLEKTLPKEKIDEIVKRTRNRGAEIVACLGTGSAYYSPSAAVFRMVDSILNDRKETIALSACLEGEYGLKDMAIGVPCRLGKNGIEEVVELKLTKTEESSFQRSAQAIKESIKLAS